MNKETIRVHRVLGISDDRQQEISNKVMETITESKLMDEGIKKVMEGGYDPESVLIGLRLRVIIDANNRMTSRPKGMMMPTRRDIGLN